MRKFTSLILTLAAMLLCVSAMAQRHFIHPGISYTQADFDRMRAMIASKQEPYYSAFQRMQKMRYTTYRDVDLSLPKDSLGRSYIAWDSNSQRQIWLDGFGKVALYNAIMWKLTDDTYYADRSVRVFRKYYGCENTHSNGTYALDNGAAEPLIEAAELMRDYEGWSEAAQDSFKTFLVFPYYTTKENLWKKYRSDDRYKNKVTIYWNIFNGQATKGNQGLYGMHCLMAMGIYLDNDTIYERALRKVLSMPHRSDDLPYLSGGFWPKPGAKPYSSMPDYNLHYKVEGNYVDGYEGDTTDYGYDDELKYWIYENGQCEESSRDQGHVMDGIGNLVDIAQIAWNQGDDIFTAYDKRLLKGITYSAKYNYSWLNEVKGERYWQGEEVFEPTVENGQFIQCLSRTHGWYSVAINPYHDTDSTWSRGEKYKNPQKMLMAYKTRLGCSDDDVLWINRACVINEDSIAIARADADYDAWSDKYAANELLTKRTVWMAGDGGVFQNKQHVSGLPKMPGSINAVDYDYFNAEVSGQGRTWYTDAERTDNLYREEGGLPITEGDDGYVLTNLGDSAWANYTFTLAEGGTYKIKVRARVEQAGATLGFSVDNSRLNLTAVDEGDDYQEYTLGTIKLGGGACVLRLYGMNTGNAVEISKITLEKVTDDVTIPVDYVWNSRDYKPVSGAGSFLTDESDTQLYSTSYSSTTQAVFTMAASDMNYRVQKGQNFLVMRGTNLDHAVLKSATYKLTDEADERTKSLTSGQSNIYKIKDTENRDVLVWKVDSAVSKRIKALLNECYANANSNYILRKLSLLVYGETTALPVTIDDFSFYTPEQMEAMNYPTPTGIDGISTESQDDTSSSIYDLQGRRVSKPLHPGVYIQNNKKIIVH
ncbi:MAG: hypothetical protein ACOYJG_12590 [Prevotella sp.]|jgi:hypothetical protein